MIIHQIKVEGLLDRVRISDYVFEYFTSYLPSKSSVKKAFKKQLILLNNQIAQSGDWLSENDVVALLEDATAQYKDFPLDLEIIFEDEYLAVIKKPAGYSVSGNFFKTIQNALSHNLKASSLDDALSIPRPVHRLDKLTSGILLVAKTRKAQIYLGSQFENQEVLKTYYALVKGSLEGEGEFDSAVDGQLAYTSYKSLRVERSLSYDKVSLIELKPKTGRTHQLRIHLAKAGHPIIGDYVHDTENVLKGKGLFLSACKISFKHPETKEVLSFELRIPNKYDSLFEREHRRWEKFKA
jgi:RluA family pseudouridine synthase